MRRRFQPRAVAGGANRVAAIARQQHADVHLVRLAFQPVEKVAHAIPFARPGFLPAHPGRVAFKKPGAGLGGQFAQRHISGHAILFRHLHQVVLTFAERLALPGLDDALRQRFRFIGRDQRKIHANHAAKAPTGFARAHRRIERKQPRRSGGKANITPRTMQTGGKRPANFAAIVGHRAHTQPPMPARKSRLQGFLQARRIHRRQPETVLHHFNFALPVHYRLRVDAHVALLFQQGGHFFFRQTLRHAKGKRHHAARLLPVGLCVQKAGDALRRIRTHGLAALRAIQRRPACVEQFQVVGQTSQRADGRARSLDAVRLPDGDGGRHVFDAAHVGLVHAFQKLPRVGRKGFHIASLPLGIERVEDQRRLARARNTRDHRHAVARNFQRQIAQVMYTSAFNADGIRVVNRHGGTVFSGNGGRPC